MAYAIVDIETTGSYAAANGIIEIAIRIVEDGVVTEQYESLVNPVRAIPRYIQAFTGITDEMVQNAPLFEDIAGEVFTLLQGNVFVAHNVNFDYSFLKSHLELCGYTLNEKRLCTIRLARKIIPGYPRYGLEHICKSLGIPLEQHHRAGSDADATVALFNILMREDVKGHIKTAIQRTSKDRCLPPNVPLDDFDALPDTPGVYYFHDSKDKIVYVGKAKNIRARVSSHFSNNSDSRQRQNFLRHTYRIRYQKTATELMASILESAEIKKWWPAFNTSQKKAEELYGIFLYEDQNGYLRLALEKKRKTSTPICTLHYKVDGYGVLRKLIREHQLCPKLCFVQTDNDACTGTGEAPCHGACEKKEDATSYNDRVMQAIAALTSRPSYIVLDKGLKDDEQSCILMVRGSFFGMGYLPKNFSEITQAALEPFITPLKENSFIQTLVHSYASRNPDTIRLLAD